MKRSNAPVFWLLFGAGGMLAALLGSNLLAYPRMLALAQNGLGKLFLFVVIALFAWHAVHRIFHSLHDLGLHTGTVAKLACYGTALAITLVTGWALMSVGF